MTQALNQMMMLLAWTFSLQSHCLPMRMQKDHHLHHRHRPKKQIKNKIKEHKIGDALQRCKKN